MVGQLSVEYAHLFGKHNGCHVVAEARDYKVSDFAGYVNNVPSAELPRTQLWQGHHVIVTSFR